MFSSLYIAAKRHFSDRASRLLPARVVGLDFWRFCFAAKHSEARNQEPKNYQPLSEKYQRGAKTYLLPSGILCPEVFCFSKTRVVNTRIMNVAVSQRNEKPVGSKMLNSAACFCLRKSGGAKFMFRQQFVA